MQYRIHCKRYINNFTYIVWELWQEKASVHVEPTISNMTVLVLATQHLSTKESGSWISSLSQFSCMWLVYTCLHVGHMCVKEEMHIACESPRLMLETIFGCFSALFPETRFSVKPSAQNVATLARQLDLQSPCLCLTRLDFQVEPHCPDNLCGFWRSKFPPSCLYSKCFNDQATFLTFYKYLWSKVGSLHKGRTKKIWRMYVAMYAPIYMGFPSQEWKLNKI